MIKQFKNVKDHVKKKLKCKRSCKNKAKMTSFNLKLRKCSL